MQQQRISRTGIFLWVGWLFVAFVVGVWVGRFGISEKSWSRWTQSDTVHKAVMRRPQKPKQHVAPVTARCRPCFSAAPVTNRPATMDELPQLAWQRLSIGQRRTTLRLLNTLRLPCGCGQTLARCIQADLGRCPQLRHSVDSVMTAVHSGDTVRMIRRRLMRRKAKRRPTLRLAKPPQRPRRLRSGRVYFVPVHPHNPSYGSTHAKLTIVIFSDFVCPSCWGVMKAIHRLEKKYGQPEVRVVFRHFPLSQHPQALPAAEASLEAHAQGKFWLFHDILFRNQGKFGLDQLTRYASALKLDTKKFGRALKLGLHRKAVQRDVRLGRTLRLPGVPFVFINGQPVMRGQFMSSVAAQSWSRAGAFLKRGVKRWNLYDTLIKFGRREP